MCLDSQSVVEVQGSSKLLFVNLLSRKHGSYLLKRTCENKSFISISTSRIYFLVFNFNSVYFILLLTFSVDIER